MGNNKLANFGEMSRLVFLCSCVLVFSYSCWASRLKWRINFYQSSKAIIASWNLQRSNLLESWIFYGVKGIASPLSKARNDRLYCRDNWRTRNGEVKWKVFFCSCVLVFLCSGSDKGWIKNSTPTQQHANTFLANSTQKGDLFLNLSEGRFWLTYYVRL